MNRRVQTGSFRASDANGNTVVLHTFVDKIPNATMDGQYSELDGRKSIFTADNEHVNFIEKGKYKIVRTGAILHSNEPGAL
jgi:hypothetical protein